jgi:hypothetical protein
MRRKEISCSHLDRSIVKGDQSTRVGFYPLPLHRMDTPKRAHGLRDLVKFAYAVERTPSVQRRKWTPPGPLFDITVLGLCLAFGILNMVS